MAVYDFKCLNCNKTFAKQQSIDKHTQSKGPPCPLCGSSQVEPLISYVNIRTSKKS